MDISEKLLELRNSSGKSQAEIAKIAGVSQRTWSSYENGQSTPKMGALLALAAEGLIIEGVTSSLMENWSEYQKKEYQRRIEILKTGVFPPEIPMDDFARIVDVVDHNPPSKKGNFNSVFELEKAIYSIIENSKIILNHESRLSALEGKYANLAHLPENKAAEPEYPKESIGKDSYTQDPVPEYGTVSYFEGVAAGPPIWQQAESDSVVDVPRHLIKTKADDYYAMRVRGNSMIDAHIPDGSMVLVKKSDAPQHQKIQVVWIDDRVTLKRMRENEDHSWTLCYEDGTERTISLGDENMVQGTFEAVLPPATMPYMREE